MRSWNAQRVGALVLYGLLVGASARGLYSTVAMVRNRGAQQQIADAYFEAVIPEPTEKNLQK